MTTSTPNPTRLQVLAAVLLLVVGLGLPGLLTPARAGTHERTTAGSLKLAPGSVAPGDSVVASGSLPPKHARPVALQVKKSGHWRTVERGHTNRRGHYKLTFTAPGGSSQRTYRVLAPHTTIKDTVWPQVTTPSRSLSVMVVTAMTAGDHHACALTAGHDLWCWGQSNYGELGNGGPVGSTTTFSSGPVKVIGTGYRQVSAGDASTCAVRTNDSLWCWGFNANGGMSDSSSPVQVAGTWQQVSVGGLTVCAVNTDDELWCWGQGMSGQLGDGQAATSYTPVQVPGSWSTVSTGGEDYPMGAATCALDTDGKAWCWGENSQGRLGTGDDTDSTTPVAVDSTATWTSVSVGYVNTCGIQADGSAWCWGNNTHGELGDGTVDNHLSPHRTTVGGSTAWTQISVGLEHSCGVQSDGSGWCWGWNDNGQIGDGTSDTTYFPAPLPSELPGSWTWVEAGFFSSVGTDSGGLPFAWGADEVGQLGDGGAAGEADSPVPVGLG